MKKKFDIKPTTPTQVRSMIENGSPINDEMRNILFEEEIRAFIKRSVPNSVMEQAKKVKVNLENEFLSLIFSVDGTMSKRERLISTLNGIIGNCWANKYFKKEGYSVENEVDIFDDKGHRVTASDIVLTSLDGNQYFIELKTMKAIIDNVNDYPSIPVETIEDSDELVQGKMISRENFIDLNKATLPEIGMITGKKVIEQLRKTKLYLDNQDANHKMSAKLCVFKGTIISPAIMEEIKKYGEIIELPLDINEIFDYSNMLVAFIMHDGRNIIHSTKGDKVKNMNERMEEKIPNLEL